MNEGTQFTTQMPLAYWYGQQTTVLQLPVSKLDDTWISYSYHSPEKYMPLSLRTNTKSEKLFFSSQSQKFYKVTSDALYWSYYNAGPFQKMEAGVWMDLDPKKDPTEEDWQDFCTLTEHYKFNTLWGTMKKVPFEVTEEAKDEEKPEEAGTQQVSAKVAEILELVKVLRKKDQPQEKRKEINDKAWEKCNALMAKLNNVADIITWKEAIIKGDGQPIPAIKTNQISNIFEEICEIYGLDYGINKVQLNTGTVKGGRPVEIFPTDSMNDVKFIMGIVLPELCLYPKTFVNDSLIDKIRMSGIFVSLYPVETAAMINSNTIYLNTKERNMMKIQQSFHECMFEHLLHRILANVYQFEDYWKSLNSPDFTYDKTRKKVPKGLKGFLTMRSVLSVENDMCSIYFALLKDPKTVLEHADIIIAKKAYILKNVLSEICPEGIDDAWWGKVQNYKDIFELSLNSTEYFKDAEGNLNKEIDERGDKPLGRKEVETFEEAS